VRPSRPRAAALRYRPQAPFLDAAPRLVAKGEGLLAERILALAREHGVPIEKDSALLEALYRLDINEEIPEELYQVVAELLAFIYRMNALKKGRASG